MDKDNNMTIGNIKTVMDKLDFDTRSALRYVRTSDMPQHHAICIGKLVYDYRIKNQIMGAQDATQKMTTNMTSYAKA